MMKCYSHSVFTIFSHTYTTLTDSGQIACTSVIGQAVCIRERSGCTNCFGGSSKTSSTHMCGATSETCKLRNQSCHVPSVHRFQHGIW
jgi:hypothetical protein